MKKIFVIICIVTAIITIIQFSAFTSNQQVLGDKHELYDNKFDLSIKVNTLTDAFKNTPASINDIDVNCWAKISDDFMDMPDAEQLCEQLFNKYISDGSKYECLKSDQKDFKQVMFTQNSNQHITVFALQTMKNSDSDISETYIMVDIKNTNFSNISELERNIKNMYSLFKVQPDCTVCVTGTIQGKADNTKLEHAFNKMLDALDVQNCNKIKDEYLTSITGYTHRINDFIDFGKYKVNINLASRYNSYEDKTYILLATPLICGEY